MYNNYTDLELINIQPATELEAELIKRLLGSTEQDWNDLKNRLEKLHTEARDSEDFIDKLRDALRKVATEIHRCAEFGAVEITPEFQQRCKEVVNTIDAYIAYDYPQHSQAVTFTINVKVGNNTHIARCNGKTASCTEGHKRAAEVCARKLIEGEFDIVELPEKRREYTKWLATPKDKK